MSARIPLDGSFLQDPDVQSVLQYYASHGLEPINILLAFANASKLLPSLNGFLVGLRTSLTLEPAEYELVILRTAHVANAPYEIVHHAVTARLAGLSEARIADTADWRSSAAYTPRQRALLSFVDAALSPQPVGDQAFAAAAGEFTPRQLMEVTLLAGAYAMVAMVARAFEVPHDAVRTEDSLKAFHQSEKRA